MVPPLPKFCAGNAASHSTNPRQGIILKFLKQPFAPISVCNTTCEPGPCI
jgi:hypothetical protein